MTALFPNVQVDAIIEQYGPAQTLGNSGPNDGLLRNKDGHFLANLANAKTILRQHPAWKGVVALDQLLGRAMLLLPVPVSQNRKTGGFRQRALTDADVVNATEWFQRNNFPTIRKDVVGDAIVSIAEERMFDPLQDKLRSLGWDGKPRIETWLIDYCAAEVSPQQPEEFVKAVGMRWLISAVARALQPGCKADSALVLVGVQGIGKSSVGRILSYDWFSDSMPPINSKDASDHVRGIWIVEFGEMATASRGDVEELKAFITRTTERFRPAYGRFELEYPRRCVFFGTSNRDQFLKDETGNRRFWPVKVTNIDLRRLQADRDQLWAEAVQAFYRGERWHLDEEELKYAEVQQSSYLVRDERTALLEERLQGRLKTTVLECIALLGMKEDRRYQMEVGGMLRLLGWSRHSGKTKYWMAPATTLSREERLYDHPQEKHRIE